MWAPLVGSAGADKRTVPVVVVSSHKHRIKKGGAMPHTRCVCVVGGAQCGYVQLDS